MRNTPEHNFYKFIFLISQYVHHFHLQLIYLPSTSFLQYKGFPISYLHSKAKTFYIFTFPNLGLTRSKGKKRKRKESISVSLGPQTTSKQNSGLEASHSKGKLRAMASRSLDSSPPLRHPQYTISSACSSYIPECI